MKKCPQCGRDYNDDSTAILSEPGAVATGFSADEPQTAVLHTTDSIGGKAASENPTQPFIQTTAAGGTAGMYAKLVAKH